MTCFKIDVTTAEFLIQTKRVQMIRMKVKEYATKSYLNYRVNITANMTKNDKKTYEKEEKNCRRL